MALLAAVEDSAKLRQGGTPVKIPALALSALLASVVLCDAAPFNLAVIEHCIGAFAAGACTVTNSSGGAAIVAGATVNTSGESVTYTASSVSKPGALGGKVSVTSNTMNSTGPGVMVDALEQLVDSVTVSFAPLKRMSHSNARAAVRATRSSPALIRVSCCRLPFARTGAADKCHP